MAEERTSHDDGGSKLSDSDSARESLTRPKRVQPKSRHKAGVQESRRSTSLRDAICKPGGSQLNKATTHKLEVDISPQQADASATSAAAAAVLDEFPAWGDLPQELLRHIASFADCKGTARLCAVNKALHRCLRDAVHIAPKLQLPVGAYFFCDRLYVPIPPPAALACMDINARHNGSSALQRAVQLRHWGMVHTLLQDPRIDPSLLLDAANAHGVVVTRSAVQVFLPTEVHAACWRGHYDSSLHDLLKLSPRGGSFLDVYLKSFTSPSLFVLAALGGCRQWLAALFTWRAVKRQHWVEALVWAVRVGQWGSVQALLELHADCERQEEHKAEYEDLALFSAVEAGQRDIVHRLLSQVQRLKYTPACYTPEGFKHHLHAAAAQGFNAILQDLLDASGFHPDSYLNGAQRLLDCAVFHGRISTVRLLLNRGSKILQGKASDTLQHPVRNLDVFMVALLLRHGADVNCPPSSGCLGEPYLHSALQSLGPKQRVESMVQLLLRHGADVHTMSAPHHETVSRKARVGVLHLAVRARQPQLVRLLLAHGADPMVKDEMGRTALHWAASCGDLGCARALLAAPTPRDSMHHLKEVQLAINMAKKCLVGSMGFGWAAQKAEGEALVALLKRQELATQEQIKAGWCSSSSGSSPATRASSSSSGGSFSPATRASGSSSSGSSTANHYGTYSAKAAAAATAASTSPASQTPSSPGGSTGTSRVRAPVVKQLGRRGARAPATRATAPSQQD